MSNLSVFRSHDGFGLGQARRNSLIASAIPELDPDAQVVLVTGLAVRPAWRGAGSMHRPE